MRQRFYGALAAACVAGIGLDAWADASGYPLFRQWFGALYDDIARTLYVVFFIGAGVFGYLAAQRSE